jgi:hypothetical protein
MRQWQKDALKVFREARALAYRTSDRRLHRACGRAIDAMVAQGGLVPSELRIYAKETRELCRDPEPLSENAVRTRLMG